MTISLGPPLKTFIKLDSWALFGIISLCCSVQPEVCLAGSTKLSDGVLDHFLKQLFGRPDAWLLEMDV